MANEVPVCVRIWWNETPVSNGISLSMSLCKELNSLWLAQDLL